MTAVWWVRRDMRLADNPALLEAQAHGPVAAVFPWSSRIHFWSGRRRAHLARVLWGLRETTGGALAVRRGYPHEVLPALAREVDARVVFAQREYYPSSIAEQDRVASALAEDGVELRLIGSQYAVPPGALYSASGTPFQVFTPFYRAWRAHRSNDPAPPADAGGFLALESTIDLDQEAARGDTEDPLAYPAEFREARWVARLEDFVATALPDYRHGRDVPGEPGTSRLSIALAFGQIHPRTILAHLPRDGSAADEAAAFERELAWRDFHADTLLQHPTAVRVSIKPVIPDDAWETGRETDRIFQDWRDGRTGYPLVDAGMRELAATGRMHNRVRMVVASFLVKDLHLPWQRGATYFRRALLDYDHAQNQLNWQWVAGTGRDASPFFRIFNPELQRKLHDPDFAYVRRWVAEVDTPAYPARMVDHAVERARSLADYRMGKDSGTANTPR
jgi:deoxyribodipyrimidine photo-lyase